MKNRNKVFLAGLTGAVVGSVATMLTTPKRGKEMREDIKEAPGKAKTQFFEKLRAGKEKAEETKEVAKEKTKRKIDEL